MIKFADNNIKLCKYGDIEIPKIYYGNDLIYQGGNKIGERIEQFILDNSYSGYAQSIADYIKSNITYTNVCAYRYFSDRYAIFFFNDNLKYMGITRQSVDLCLDNSISKYSTFYILCSYVGYRLFKMVPTNVWDSFGKFYGRASSGSGFVRSTVKSWGDYNNDIPMLFTSPWNFSDFASTIDLYYEGLPPTNLIPKNL